MSRIIEHTEINEHLGRIAENLIIEHLFCTISTATNNRTPGIFSHCVNSETCLTNRDTRVVKPHGNIDLGQLGSGKGLLPDGFKP